MGSFSSGAAKLDMEVMLPNKGESCPSGKPPARAGVSADYASSTDVGG
jgi:hypothetical protein